MLSCLAQLHHFLTHVLVYMIQELLFLADTVLPPLEIEEPCLRPAGCLVVLTLIGKFLNRFILMLVDLDASVLFASFRKRWLVISMRRASFWLSSWELAWVDLGIHFTGIQGLLQISLERVSQLWLHLITIWVFLQFNTVPAAQTWRHLHQKYLLSRHALFDCVEFPFPH
jgi:hypothetical protein